MDQHRPLEFCIMSASDLKDIRFLARMETYAVASMAPFVEYTTKVDSTGGTNPVWSEKFSFMVPDRVLQQRDTNMTIDIFTMGTWRDRKLVGSVSIPMSDIGGLTREQIARSTGILQHKSYPVKAHGKYEGELHVSFLLGETIPLKDPAYPVWSHGSAAGAFPASPPSVQLPPPAYSRPSTTPASPPSVQQPRPSSPLATRPPGPPLPTFDSSRGPISPGILGPAPGHITGFFANPAGKKLLTELISDSPYDRGYRA